MPTPRKRGRPWQRLQKKLKADPRNHYCCKCGRWINIGLHHNDPMAWTLDHSQALVHDGAEFDERNIRPAHRSCNSSAGSQLRRFTRVIAPPTEAVPGTGRGRGVSRDHGGLERPAATVPSLPPREDLTPPIGVTGPRPAVTPAPAVPDGLGPRGRRLWVSLHDGERRSTAESALIEEACRTADRLDKLDRLLTGEAEDWLRLVEAKGDPDRQEVVIDKPLAEARQQQVVFAKLLAELRQRAAAGSRPARNTSGGPSSVSGDLRSRVAAAWGAPPAG